MKMRYTPEVYYPKSWVRPWMIHAAYWGVFLPLCIIKNFVNMGTEAVIFACMETKDEIGKYRFDSEVGSRSGSGMNHTTSKQI